MSACYEMLAILIKMSLVLVIPVSEQISSGDAGNTDGLYKI